MTAKHVRKETDYPQDIFDNDEYILHIHTLMKFGLWHGGHILSNIFDTIEFINDEREKYSYSLKSNSTCHSKRSQPVKVTKPLLFALAALLTACSDPTDITVGEMLMRPEKAIKVREAMSTEDLRAFEAFPMTGADLDKVTVKEAIKIGKARLAEQEKNSKAGR